MAPVSFVRQPGERDVGLQVRRFFEERFGQPGGVVAAESKPGDQAPGAARVDVLGGPADRRVDTPGAHARLFLDLTYGRLQLRLTPLEVSLGEHPRTGRMFENEHTA